MKRFYIGLAACLLTIAVYAGTGTNSMTGNPVGTTGTFTAGNCLKAADTQGTIQDSGSACASGSGTVTSVGVTSTGSTVTVTGSPVTTSGNINVEVAALPSAVPAAGSVVSTNIAAPSSPASGKDAFYSDSTDLRFHDKNASGTIGTTVVADTGAANNFLTAISAAGVISKAQPTPTNVGLGSVTNDAQTKAAIVPNTAPSAGQILAGNAGGTAYAPVSLSGSGATMSLASTGVLSISAIPATSITTGTSGANIPLLNGNNTYSGTATFSGAMTESANGAASTSPLLMSGTILTGGTGTTNFPNLFLQPTGTTAATTWSTSGTGLGMNLASGFAGNFFDVHTNGGASLFKVDSAGGVTTAGNITATSGVAQIQNLRFTSVLQGPSTHALASGTAPTIGSGFGTSPSVVANNGTAAFTINVGTGGSASSGVVTMPAATTGWACNVTPNGAPQANAIMYSAPTSTTSITITNYTLSTAAALAWPASAVLQVMCVGY